MKPRWPVAAAFVALLIAGASSVASEAEAQGVRGTARTTARYLEMRPITRDTVPRSLVTELPGGGLVYEGRPVFCTGAVCIFYRSMPVQEAVAFGQEVGFTAWGLGMQGLSATVLVRARGQLGGEFSLPRTDDPFDAILAYAELDRPPYRLRLGRQENASQLGAPGFDGASVLFWPIETMRIEGFGGRSLGRGLHEPRSSALRGLEDAAFLLHEHSFIGGVEVGMDRLLQTDVVARYYREIFGDRSALLSERASLAVRSGLFSPVLVRGTAEYDFGHQTVGKAHLTATAPVTSRTFLELTARRYKPLFELWTIWGFFSPVAYHEGEMRASWNPSRTFGAWLSGAYRAYEETEAEVFGNPLMDRAWRASAGGSLRPRADLNLSGAYEVEGPVGAFLSSGHMAATWRAADRLDLSLRGVAAQQIEEFRIGEGYLLGAGVGLGAELRQDLRLSGGFDLYRHTSENRPSAADWNQRRGWMMLQVGFGRDAGVPRRSEP
jgi:hypothetical protein